MSARIYRFGLRLTHSSEDAEDLTVQTFAEAHQSRSSFQNRASLETWMFRIAVFQAHRILRRRKAEGPLDEFLPDLGSRAQFESIELESLIAELPPRLRIALILVKGEGLTYREASEALGRPIGTVQWQVNEALKLLRSALDPAPARIDIAEKCTNEV